MLKNGYNLMAEYVVLFFALLTLVLMLYTKPKKTRLFGVCLRGLLLSIAAVVCQMGLFFSGQTQEKYGTGYFGLLCLIFICVYCLIIIYLFTYVYLYATNENRKSLINYYIKVTIVCAVYLVIAFYLLATGKMVSLTESGVEFRWFIVFYTIVGIICNVSILIVSLLKRKYMPRNAFYHLMIYVPINLVLLVAQVFETKIVFSSATYVTPFIMFYILFHSMPYKDIGGCQGQDSLETRCADNNRHKKKSTMVLLYFPQLKNLEITTDSEFVNIIADEMCKEFEQLDRKIYNHRIDRSTYVVCIQGRGEQRVKELMNRMESIVVEHLQNAPFHMYYKMIAFENKENFEQARMVNGLFEFLLEKYGKGSDSLCYMATEQDVADFFENNKIEQVLLSIRNQMDLDDEHVLCYAQPIYSVQNNSFCTAESLMRLQIDGKMIFPDRFIPLAERNNCMHVLTCIMINKVCKKVRELKEDYEFDAITINCSASELSDRNFCKDVLRIIRNNEIVPTKIRLELTESMMIENYEAVMYNMVQLNQSGIEFYLDDFGTGYSNFERIINCPFHTIKFDKTMLYRALDDESMNDLMTYMVRLFKKQGLKMLVEGVEDEVQNKYSIEHGFDYIQGYKYAKPQPMDELVNYFYCKNN